MKNTGTLKVTTATEREVVMTRVFDAPRRLAFDALTKPELFKRWFGPRGWSLAVGCAWPRWHQHGDARRLPGDRAAGAPRQHGEVRRLSGRVAQYVSPGRAGRQDYPYNHGAVRVSGDSRRGD